MILYHPCTRAAIVIAILLAALASFAANRAPAGPPGSGPQPTATGSSKIPKADPLLNQLYRARFGVDPSGYSRKTSTDEPVSMVVELADDSADAVVTEVEALGGSVDRIHRNLVFVDLQLEHLPLLAASDEILRIRRPYRSEPDVESEGVGLHLADDMHDLGLTGNGVKVGVLDCGGFTGYAALLGTELPPSVNLWTGGSNPVGSNIHGTGCAEIVHDMAPGAELYFAHDGTEADFYDAVDWLIAMGVDVVSYSCSWTIPAPRDGAGLPYNPVNEKIAEARSAGILWVNSAGNAANDDNYQHPFTDPGGDNWHDFDDYFANGWGWLQTGNSYYSVLCWNDWPADPTVSGSTQDYDLYLWWWDGAAWQQVAQSNNPQNGNPGELPCEEIEYSPAVDDWYWLAVWRAASDGSQFLNLRKDSAGAFTVNNPEHSIAIPAESPAALAVGAVHWSSLDLEPFSSRGPTLGPGGAPTGGLLKPDIVAVDAVSTFTYGPSDGQPWLSGTGFFGTSAACPHVAGGAALLLEENPALSPDELEAQLVAAAFDMGPAGPDNDFGSGMMILKPSLIFTDDFESGDTTAWSDTSP